MPLKYYRYLYRTSWRWGSGAVRTQWYFNVFLGHPTKLENQIGDTRHGVFYPTAAGGLVTSGWLRQKTPSRWLTPRWHCLAAWLQLPSFSLASQPRSRLPSRLGGEQHGEMKELNFCHSWLKWEILTCLIKAIKRGNKFSINVLKGFWTVSFFVHEADVCSGLPAVKTNILEASRWEGAL